MMAKKDELVHYDFKDDECGVKWKERENWLLWAKKPKRKRARKNNLTAAIQTKFLFAKAAQVKNFVARIDKPGREMGRVWYSTVLQRPRKKKFFF